MNDDLLLFGNNVTPVPLSATEPLLLDRPGLAWWVQSGYVDLFVTALEHDRPVGRRHFLARIREGALVFGLPAERFETVNAKTYAVLAVGGLGSRLLPLEDRERLAEHPTRQVAALVNAWICGLADFVGNTVSNWPQQIAPQHGTVRLAAQQTLCGQARRVTWLESASSELDFLDISIPDSIPIPVMGKTWVKARAATEVYCCTTDAMLTEGRLWHCLDAYHHLALKRIAHRLEVREMALIERMQVREKSDRLVLESGFTGLADVVFGVAHPVEIVQAPADPLLAAVRQVGDALGVQIRAPQLHEDSKEATLAQIVRTSRLRARKVVLHDKWWLHDNGPMIAFREDGSPVALIPGHSGRYRLIDTARQEHCRVDEEVAMDIRGEAYMLYRRFPYRRLSVVDVMRMGLHGVADDLRTAAFMGVAGGLLALVTPIVTGVLVGQVIPRAAQDQLWQLIAGLGVAAVAAIGFQFTRAIALLRIQGRLDWHLQAALFDRLLCLSTRFFKNYSTGDLVDRVMSIQSIRETLSASAINSFVAGLFSLFSFALLFYYSWKLALIALLLVTVSVLVTLVLSLLQLRQERRHVRQLGKVEGLVQQLLMGIAKLRVAGAEPRALAVWTQEYGAQKRRFVAAQRFANMQEVFQSVFTILAALGVFMGVVWIIEGDVGAMGLGVPFATPGQAPLSTGDFIAFNAAFGQFLSAMFSMALALTSVLQIIPLYERAQPLLQAKAEYDQTTHFPGRLKGEIELSEVTFRYLPQGPSVLDQLSLHVDAGEFVAIVGPSGSGKSTVFRLLLGFETAQQGGIFYDGRPLDTLDKQGVRRQIGMVMQNGRLLSGTILENIGGGARLSMEEAWHAVRLVGLDEDIKAMPMGMHTVLTEGASTLSGGQRQRLMIARALIHQPSMLFLDEATSALDNRTQAIVTQTLARMNVTRLVIAHRLSTIRGADRIIVLDNGRVVQFGTFEVLMDDRDGAFHNLATRQLL